MKIDDFCRTLYSFDSYLIFCHTRPDGDTIGSALALKAALIKSGKVADIVCSSPVPESVISPVSRTYARSATESAI